MDEEMAFYQRFGNLGHAALNLRARNVHRWGQSLLTLAENPRTKQVSYPWCAMMTMSC